MAIQVRFQQVPGIADTVVANALPTEGNPAVVDNTSEFFTVSYPNIEAWDHAISRLSGKVKYWRIE